MKTIVVYDSLYGNTEQIARSIGRAISSEAKVLRLAEVTPADLEQLDLLIVGSPTQGAKATPAIQGFINSLSENCLKGKCMASFDTRFSIKTGSFGSRLIARMARKFGFAAEPIAEVLQAKGGRLVKPPEGFIVRDVKGPLADGELERAAIWAKDITAIVSRTGFGDS